MFRVETHNRASLQDGKNRNIGRITFHLNGFIFETHNRASLCNGKTPE